MASSSQPTVNQEISESTSPDAADHSTKAENLPPNNVKGSDNANMSDPQSSVNQEISKSTTEAEKKNVKGSENANMLDQKPSVNQETSKSTTEAENLASKNVKGFENANQLGQQPSVNPETSKSTTEAENLVSKNVNESENANELGKQAGSSQSTQEIISKPTVPDLINHLIAEAKNVTDQDMSKLIAGLEEKRVFFIKWHNNTTGALVQTVLESILKEPFSDLKADSNGKEVASREKQLKGKLDELNWVVSMLNLQEKLLLDSESKVSPKVSPKLFPEVSPKVSKINDTIIPGVVSRLELAMKYSLSQRPPDKDDSISGKEGSSHSSRDGYDQRMGEQAQNLMDDLRYIRSFLKNLEDNFNNLSHRLVNLERNASFFVNALLRHSSLDDLGTGRLQAGQLEANLRVLKTVVIALKHQISSPYKLLLTDSDTHWYTQVSSAFDYSQVLDIMPVLHVREKFKNSSAFRDFRGVYESLELTTKMCCLCFAIIPENEEVKKRFMTHWWVGEGFVTPVERAADGIFEELVKKNCIEPVNQKLRYVVDSYKMDPCIRSAVIVLAKEARFFDFDDKGNPSANCKSSYRACLGDGFNYQKLFKNESLVPEKKIKNELDPEKVQVIFNVNEPYPDVFELEWFSKLKNVKVLYLGRWQTSANHHIEVNNIKFLKGLKSMKLLRSLSLQGISGIMELPRSVCDLLNLRILDLRACHDLEALPDAIGSLKMLTHLDISECYLLDYMPKGIASLSALQVLKGFVISDYYSSKSCTLDHLAGLEKLSKLSIYTNKEAFPKTEDVTTLEKFKALRKLTITWGAGAFQPKADSNAKEDEGAPQPKAATTTNSKNVGGKKTQDVGVAQATAPTIPFTILEKLDLKCYPRRTAPSWLLPGNFAKLEKLYIREGNLQNICPVQENYKWTNVKALRLKSLSDLKMDWKKLLSSFPQLTYLEKFKCPKLTYFPCNENGVVRLQKP